MTLLNENELYVPVKGGKLFCRAVGEKNAPLIVMHGGPGLGQNYLLPQMMALQQFAKPIFYDQRGTGKSESNTDWQTSPFQTYVDDVEAIRKAFGLESVSLLGHSWGGVVISLYALAYPQRVDKMIYVNTIPLSSADYTEFVLHRNQVIAFQDELAAIRESQAFKQGEPGIVNKYYRIYFKNYFVKPENMNALTLTMSEQEAVKNFATYNVFYNYMANHPFDLYLKLKALNKPSLIVACDKDIIPYHYMEYLHKSIPDSQLVLIENSGHFPYVEQPEKLFELVKNFLRG